LPSQRQLTTSGNLADCALSPDGKSLAYTAGGTLYLRDLASNHTRTITDRLLRFELTWSRDSKQLYFAHFENDDVQMARLVVDGGVPVHVPWLDRHLVSVGPDGTQLAETDYPARAISIVDNQGHGLEKVKVGGDYTWLYYALYSPTGDRFLVMTTAGEQHSARLISRDGTREAMLPLDHVTQVGWYSDDALWLTRREEGAFAADVMIQPLDASGLHVAGEPRLVLPEVHARTFSVDATGRTAAYVSSQAVGAEIWTVTVGPDDKPHARRLDFGTALTCSATMAPDASRVAVSSTDGERGNIAIVPFAGGESRFLTRTPSCANVEWSPDGQLLAWREGAELVISDPDGAPPRRLKLTNASGGDDGVAWASPDRVLYHVEGHRQWRGIDIRSGAITPLTDDKNGWYFNPTLTPDGKRVAVLWNRRDAQGIWTIDLADGSQHFLGGGSMAHAHGWSSDGKYLYVSDGQEQAAQGALRVGRLPAQGGAVQPWLTLPLSGQSACEFARDGRRAVCIDVMAHGDLWLIENFGALVDAAR
jgi:Tol biopolymer transport system component